MGSCFSNLVLGVDNSLRTYVLTQDPARQLAQQEGMQRFQAFALKAQYRSAALRYGAAPARPRPAVRLNKTASWLLLAGIALGAGGAVVRARHGVLTH